MKIEMPEQARQIIDWLEAGGFEAYIVGGCVRDSLLGRDVHDWDICTSARPMEMKRCLRGYKLLETGIKHGTLTAVVGEESYEITTFRVDGLYSDNRRPDNVTFVRSLTEDLARRDFTINAMAYNDRRGLSDPFGGRDDLEKGLLRCVGEPEARFSEDALRILRALRIAAVYGFIIEEQTAKAAMELRHTLRNISAERISVELKKLLTGQSAVDILRQFRDIIAVFIPEIAPMFNFDQHNPYHVYDVWEHTLRTVEAVENTPLLRLTMLLHDISKPECFSMDKKGVGHFYGHQERGAEKVRRILRRLKFDNDTQEDVCALVKYHDIPFDPTVKIIRRRLSKIGRRRFELLLKIKEADARGQNPEYLQKRLNNLEAVKQILEKIDRENLCYTVSGLDIRGDDLLALGFNQGPAVGETLEALLTMVINETLENSRAALLAEAKKRLAAPATRTANSKFRRKNP
jgi:tRNA nucleotidyltransferase (CCA-adding enzyme)